MKPGRSLSDERLSDLGTALYGISATGRVKLFGRGVAPRVPFRHRRQVRKVHCSWGWPKAKLWLVGTAANYGSHDSIWTSVCFMLRNQHHETMTASPLKPAQANDNRRFTHVSNHLELMASICYQSDNAFVTRRICALTRDHVS